MRSSSLMLASLAALVASGCANPPDIATADANRLETSKPAHEDRELMALTSSRMTKFASERDFLDYVRRVRDIAEKRGGWWAGVDVVLPTESVVVTGSKILAPPSPAAPATTQQVQVFTPESAAQGSENITNVQKIGVDEGDIVKLVGQYLVVLQDGRLFSIDLTPGGTPGLKLADRVNVYTSTKNHEWYDEMLVAGDRILVTSYSYSERGTKLSVFRIDAAGKMTGEGAFVISSNDYYSTENYATRLVDDKLVIYAPLYLRAVDPDTPVQWPLVRRWRKNSDTAEKEGARLFDARSIYRPMQPTLDPVVHSVSVCDLGTPADENNVPCRATSIVGPSDHILYYSPTDAWLWAASSDNSWDEMCRQGDASRFKDGLPAGLYRVPLSGAKPKMLKVRGKPKDQFSLDSNEREIRGLLMWGNSGCDRNNWRTPGDVQLKYFHAPLSLFSDEVWTAPKKAYVDAPAPGGVNFENRFTDSYVVYGSRIEGWSYPPQSGEAPRASELIALPVTAPEKATRLAAPHGVMRTERVGDDIVVTGYRDDKGLSLSYVDLSAAPTITSTEVLENRFESEGRSHAFNSRRDAEGGGLIGIPTVERKWDSGRWWWRSRVSDLSFLSFSAEGKMAPLGELTGRENSEDKSYVCEMSCIDWYGNSRPFFISGRIYALSGTELVEGTIADGGITEARRLNLTAPIRAGTSDLASSR